MTGDVCRAITGKLPRKPEKRKKKRAKKKTSMAHGPESGPPSIKSPPEDPEALFPDEKAGLEELEVLPQNTHDKGKLSPRKQALMRHKSSRESVGEPSFVSEVKQIKKNRKAPPVADTVDGKYLYMLASQPMDEKAALFSAPMAGIVLYHESVHDSPLRASPGTLLAHGEFEIFQLHGGDVTYLACGKSFVYPLLPKLKILRTSACEFVLPLVNPQRYWKIHIDSADDAVFHALETVLQKVVRYTNLAATEIPHAGHVADVKTPVVPKPDPFTLLYFNDIPESPPSVSASPQPGYNDLGTPSSPEVPLLLPYWEEKAVNTITYGIATLGVPRLIHPRPHALANPFYHDSVDVKMHQPDPESDSLSMDSLLDEYEETISVTKSVQHHVSRPVSRTASHVSARSSVNHHYKADGHDLPLYRYSPAAAHQRRYGKTKRQNSMGARSRRSSISELYSSTSNWMEPGHAPHAQNKLSSSRSTYSLAPHKALHGNPNLNETCREIYRSITLHNLALIAVNDAGPQMEFAATAPVVLKSKGMEVPQKPVAFSAGVAETYPGNHPFNPQNRNLNNGSTRTDGLSSTEVFRLLSRRDNHKQQQHQHQQPPTTGLRRLFGW